MITLQEFKAVYLPELEKRVKSLAWRALVMFLLGLIAYLVGILPNLNLPQVLTVFLGLVLNEGTKWLNSHTDIFGKAQKGKF